LNFSFSNTNGKSLRNVANLTIQINVCKYSVSQKLWQPIQDPTYNAIAERHIAYEFSADGPNYFALIATTQIDAIRVNTPPELNLVEPEHSIVAALAAGISGGVILIAALYGWWYMRRRNRRRVLLAAYYQATVAAARKRTLKLAADATNQDLIKPPESGNASPRKRPHQKATTVKKPNEVVRSDSSPPPPPHGFLAEKSLVAAAIRSKFKHANRLKHSSPTICVDQDLEFELKSTEDSDSFVSQHISVDEIFDLDVDAIEVESVDSAGYGERQLDASSSCSAISMADKSETSDLEDAGIAPPAMLPLNDFECDSDELNRYPETERPNRPSLDSLDFASSPLPRNAASTSILSVQENLARDSGGLSRLQSSSITPRLDAKLWKEQNGSSFDA